jgi:hypothetical protein
LRRTLTIQTRLRSGLFCRQIFGDLGELFQRRFHVLDDFSGDDVRRGEVRGLFK